MPAADRSIVFSALKSVLAKYAEDLAVKVDIPHEYTLVTKSAPSPPPHKGQPMFFGSLRETKAYVSFHLMPLYTNPDLPAGVSPSLKKHMQGKTCFNFRKVPAPEAIEELDILTGKALEDWRGKDWL